MRLRRAMQPVRNSDNPLHELLANLPPAAERLSDYVIEHSLARPNMEASVDAGLRLTYAELAREVACLAGLLKHLGLTPGERVAVLAPPSNDFLISFLAVTCLGGIWLGLNPKHTRAELQYVLLDAAPRFVLARSRIAGRDLLEDLRELVPSKQLQPRLLLLDSHPDAAEYDSVHSLLAMHGLLGRSSIPQQAASGDSALLVYTSGTTGRPKGALLSHRALIRGALVRNRAWPIKPLRSLNNLPINHIGAVGDICCTTLVAGGCQVFMERFDPGATLRTLEAERISFWYQIPTMFQLCLAHSRAASTDWAHLDTAIWSGGRAPHELIRQLGKVAKHLAVDYSMTESVGSITLTPRTRDVEVLAESVGWPDPGRNLRVVDPHTLQPVGENAAGELQVNDRWQLTGYRSDGGSSDAFTSDGWFRTGDLAVWQPNGTLRLVGRLKEMFKSGGYNIYPKEIEQVIERHPGVAMTAVVPVEDALYGEVGVAFIVPRDLSLSNDALAAHCRDSLANYKIPKHFVLIPELPMLPIGKIDRMALRQRARAMTR